MNGQWFPQVDEPKVPIYSISALKTYLLGLGLQHRGLPVRKFLVRGTELRAKLEFPDGSFKWDFFGRVADVAKDVQLGLYEKEPKDGR